MPEWIHDRAQRLRASNPDMSESEAWAISTQQSHALGKTPKSYGTSEGRERARAKYKTPNDDQKTAEGGLVAIHGLGAMLTGFADEVEKIAIFGGLAAGPLGHVAVNALGRAARKGSNLSDYLAHTGLQHGLTGSSINPFAQRTIKALAGPESLSHYEAAKALGSLVQHLPTNEQHAIFQGMRQGTGRLSEDTPLLSPMHRAMGHELEGTAPALQSKGLLAGLYSKGVAGMGKLTNTPFDTGAQRVAKSVAGAAPLAAVAAADPVAAATHVGFNTAREAVAKSSTGKRVMKGMLERGLGGQLMSPAVEKAVDYGVSPSALDPMRIGKALREVTPTRLRSQLPAAPDRLQQFMSNLRAGSMQPVGA